MERLEPKAPVEVTDYRFTWDKFLGADTISTSTFVVTGATKVSDTHDATSTTVTISGGVAGTVAKITNTITTAGGLTETELFTLPITAADEPVSLEEAKAHLRVVDDSEDVLIQSYIRSARAYVESESGYVFVRRQFLESFNHWPNFIQLGRRPIISVDAIDYQASDGTVTAFTDFRASQDFRRVSPVSAWPMLVNGGSVSLRYTAGFDEGDTAEEVELARQAILLLVGHWFENRGTVSVDERQAFEVPFAATSLINRFRAVTV